ncbi:MAG TPA: hypothetical protein VGR73_07380 [Bryobacteraceae bacterium]|nr:hypothetical protein [Bryobacteraceae bacterium]
MLTTRTTSGCFSGAKPVVALPASKEFYVAGAGRGKALNGIFDQIAIAAR